jgi:hypothetical protein
MRYALVIGALLVATACPAADGLPKATRVIEGQKTTFPESVLPEGVKVVVAALESCSDVSDGTVRYTPDDLKKARQNDHVSLVFPRALGVTVAGKKLEVSEVVYADGVFWLLCGNEAVRCTKYEHRKFEPFREWYRQTLPAD